MDALAAPGIRELDTTDAALNSDVAAVAAPVTDTVLVSLLPDVEKTKVPIELVPAAFAAKLDRHVMTVAPAAKPPATPVMVNTPSVPATSDRTLVNLPDAMAVPPTVMVQPASAAFAEKTAATDVVTTIVP
jgi:hypothetical protein